MTPFRSLLAAALLATALPAVAEDAPRKSTANANVHVLAPMKIAGLDRDRTVRIYLPPGYATSGKRYRVLYLYDGQNLFDDATSYVGEWGVDESLDALAAEGLEFIAVGIDHGAEKRINELNPWNPLDPKYAPPEGIAFLRFVVEQVKPFVEANYRTLPGRENAAIGGSSLGGQMAHYALEKHPALFGRALVFSPAYWIGGESAYDYTAGRPLPPGTRYYAVTGSKEGDQAIAGLEQMAAVLAAGDLPGVTACSEVREGAEHNETFWKAEFPQAIRWLFPAPEVDTNAPDIDRGVGACQGP
jgi:predicted alpha/beta superfamily hydrolase